MRLNAGRDIHKHLLEAAWHHNAANGLLMSLAYHAGAAALEAVLPLLRDNGRKLERLTSGSRIQYALAERLTLFRLPTDDTSKKELLRLYHDLLDTFPRFEPKLDLIGTFSQIVVPFEGKLSATSTAKSKKKAVFNRAA